MRSPRSGGQFAAELHDRLGGGYRFGVSRIWDTNGPVIQLVPEQRPAAGTTALDVSVELRDGDKLIFRVARRCRTRRCPGRSSFSSAQ
jgi:hypothetical protein